MVGTDQYKRFLAFEAHKRARGQGDNIDSEGDSHSRPIEIDSGVESESKSEDDINPSDTDHETNIELSEIESIVEELH